MQEQNTDSDYDWLLNSRRFQLAVSSLVLLGIIMSICIRKIYVYNTIRLLMFVCICDFIGMFIVLLFDPRYITHSCSQIKSSETNSDCSRQSFTNSDDVFRVLCGLMGFINLFSYALGYFFAVLISYNVYSVFSDNHRNFMRTIFQNKKIIIFLIIMLIVYTLPFIFIFFQNVGASYGPAGFKFGQNQYIFFCGVFSKSGQHRQPYIFIATSLFVLVFILFIIHFLILYRIRYLINYMNSKQQFLIRSGNIGQILFLVQILNFFKEIMNTTLDDAKLFILILNYLFDLYPLLILGSYIYYTRLHQRSRLINSTLLSIENR